MKDFVKSATVSQFLFECHWLNVSMLIIYAIYVVCSDMSLSKIHVLISTSYCFISYDEYCKLSVSQRSFIAYKLYILFSTRTHFVK